MRRKLIKNIGLILVTMIPVCGVIISCSKSGQPDKSTENTEASAISETWENLVYSPQDYEYSQVEEATVTEEPVTTINEYLPQSELETQLAMYQKNMDFDTDLECTKDNLLKVCFNSIGQIPYQRTGVYYMKGFRQWNSDLSDIKNYMGLNAETYINWVYRQLLGTQPSFGDSPIQYYADHPESRLSKITDLQVGDIGLLSDSPTGKNDVGIYIGLYMGQPVFVHCSNIANPFFQHGGVGASYLKSCKNDILTCYRPVDYKYFFRPDIPWKDTKTKDKVSHVLQTELEPAQKNGFSEEYVKQNRLEFSQFSVKEKEKLEGCDIDFETYRKVINFLDRLNVRFACESSYDDMMDFEQLDNAGFNSQEIRQKMNARLTDQYYRSDPEKRDSHILFDNGLSYANNATDYIDDDWMDTLEFYYRHYSGKVWLFTKTCSRNRIYEDALTCECSIVCEPDYTSNNNSPYGLRESVYAYHDVDVFAESKEFDFVLTLFPTDTGEYDFTFVPYDIEFWESIEQWDTTSTLSQ